jgi:hypothetical protein
MSSRLVLAAIAAAGVLGSARPAGSAPVPITGDLPLDDDIVEALRQSLSWDEFGATVEFLSSLRVFPDDGSGGRTTVYLAPFFTADETQEVIGGQEIATDLLQYLDVLDGLLLAIGGSYHEFDRLQDLRAAHLAFADRLTRMTDNISENQRQGLIAYARNSPDVADLDAMPLRMTSALEQVSPARCREIAEALLDVLMVLGVPISDADRQLAESAPVQFALGVPTRVRTRIATMLLGVRHATFIGGMTFGDTRFFENYFYAAPGVRITTLPIQTLRVVPVASVFGLVSEAGGVSAPEMIRGVNAATNGVCGTSTQCTVLVEYTEMGARSALLSTRGAALLPVEFVGDVAVSASALLTPTSCDIEALRRHLVLPFGLEMLGDREIQRTVAAAGVCHTPSGDPANLLASAVTVSTLYRNLFYDAGLVPASQRDGIAREITDLLANTPGAQAALGSVGAILPQVDVDSFLTNLSRSLYTRLMPRLPDELIAGLIVTSSPSAPATTRFDFDGFPIACWKRATDGSTYLSACPGSAPDADSQDWVARALHDRLCQQGSLELADCATAIQALPPDSQGFLWTNP